MKLLTKTLSLEENSKTKGQFEIQLQSHLRKLQKQWTAVGAMAYSSGSCKQGENEIFFFGSVGGGESLCLCCLSKCGYQVKYRMHGYIWISGEQ